MRNLNSLIAVSSSDWQGGESEWVRAAGLPRPATGVRSHNHARPNDSENRFRRSATTFAIAISAVILAHSPAVGQNNQTRITVSFEGSEDRVRPSVENGIRFRDTFIATLSGGNKVTERQSWGGRSFDTDTNLGKLRTGTLTSRVQSTWHVLPGNRLLRIAVKPQSLESIEISLFDNHCTVSVKETLKPGFSEFAEMSWTSDELHYFSRREITSTSCSVE